MKKCSFGRPGYRGVRQVSSPQSAVRQHGTLSESIFDALSLTEKPIDVECRTPGGSKRHIGVHEVMNGIRYILRTGCQWRAAPKHLPPRSTPLDYLYL
jgi:transposase